MERTIQSPDTAIDRKDSDPGDSTPRNVEQLRTVYLLTDAVSRARRLEEIYEAALQGLERALGTDRTSILLYDPDGVMRFKAWHGLSDGYRAAVEGHSPWERDVQDPDPVLVPDVALDPVFGPYLEIFEREGIRALAFVPLDSRGRLIGKFMVYFDRPHALGEDEVLLARAIAGHVAFAVERKRNEGALKLYREIFAHSSDAIGVIGPDGRYLEQNASHRALIGYDDHELLGRTPALHLGEDLFGEIAQALGSDGLYRKDVTSTAKSGLRQPIELSAFSVRDESGQPVCFVGIKRDITERKRVEGVLTYLAGASAALDRSLDYEATLEEVARLTVPYLADWVLVETLDETGGLHLAAGVHADPRMGDTLTKLLALRSAGEGESLALEAIGSGRPRLVARAAEALAAEFGPGPEAEETLREVGARSAMALPLRARGRMLGALTLVSGSRVYEQRDVALAEDLARRGATALHNARLYREAQDSDRRKEEFLAVLAHELRNPLMPLVTCLELMRAHDGDPESLRRWRDIMDRQIRTLARLVDDLMDVSRITRGKIELKRQTVALSTVIARAAETTRPFFESRRITLAVEVDPDARFECDPLRLEQVFSNLLNNAVKFTQAGGRVDVKGAREGDRVTVRVRDYGVGIESDMLTRVFDLFVQGSKPSGGLGIGLTLARTLVELHGGTVRAESEGLGSGTEFVVRLPLGNPAEAGTERRESGRALDIRGPARRTLIVDDNVDSATALAEALRLRGHEIHVAHDGRGALLEAERTRPDFVLLDLGLPDIDGFEVANRLRMQPLLSHTKLIAVSGYGQEHHQRRSAQSGFVCHLVKPIDLAQLDALMDRLSEDIRARERDPFNPAG